MLNRKLFEASYRCQPGETNEELARRIQRDWDLASDAIFVFPKERPNAKQI